eukprot:6172920-Pleurochrysis_carterae.AAC.3
MVVHDLALSRILTARSLRSYAWSIVIVESSQATDSSGRMPLRGPVCPLAAQMWRIASADEPLFLCLPPRSGW